MSFQRRVYFARGRTGLETPLVLALQLGDAPRRGKGELPRQHPVQRGAKLPKVDSRIQRLAADLFGRHIPRRADDAARRSGRVLRQ